MLLETLRTNPRDPTWS